MHRGPARRPRGREVDNGDVALTDLGGALVTAAIALTSDNELD
jgi:hypothetical protein